MRIVETILPAGEIIDIQKRSDGTLVVRQKVLSNDAFILVEAEKLSLKDEFMQWEPNTKKEKILMKFIAEAIRSGVKNFYRPKYDPSFADNGGIQFVAGKNPAVRPSYDWWKDIAEKYNPERNSRLGTRLEYAAFLGILIKKLVEEGKSLEWAWNAVCNNSKELGHYYNSENANHLKLEPTGSRCICGFYDLANTYKFLARDSDMLGFWMVSGQHKAFGHQMPLANFNVSIRNLDKDYYGVGWIVLS